MSTETKTLIVRNGLTAIDALIRAINKDEGGLYETLERMDETGEMVLEFSWTLQDIMNAEYIKTARKYAHVYK